VIKVDISGYDDVVDPGRTSPTRHSQAYDGLRSLLGAEADIEAKGPMLMMAADAVWEWTGANAPGFLNERLMSDLRPTLFLAQLSNLLAGNIAIVHGLGGTSRTFMGEEVAGADAARIALARIASGESDIALIGGSHNGERKDLMVLYEFGDFNLKDKFAPVWARKDHAGFALGSAGAFLVLESKAHAEARGAKPFAKLSSVGVRMTPPNVLVAPKPTSSNMIHTTLGAPADALAGAAHHSFESANVLPTLPW